MQKSALIRLGTLAALVAAAACADGTMVAPDAATAVASGPARASAATASAAALPDENVSVSPFLAEINARLATAGVHLAVQKAELLVDANTWDGVSSTVLIANNRSRGIGAEWVAGDPRRAGRVGVTYAFGSSHPLLPLTRNPDGSNLRQVPVAQLDAQIEESLASWRAQACSAAPITRVSIPAGTDPDYLDDLFRTGAPSGTYAQPADIVESGWAPASFFTGFAGPSGASIIGVTFTFIFTDDHDVPTDIDKDGNEDTALAEIYYNTRFAWGTTQAPNVVDFYSIITHETGHALGLAHFGKVFVTKKDAADGISIADIKYAPKAMMNAVYVTGRGEIAGTDNSSFCQIWASKK
jgi:hypothetical protein